MKLIQLTNTALNQTEMYEVDAETFAYVWDLMNNNHKTLPIRVPKMIADKVASSHVKRSQEDQYPTTANEAERLTATLSEPELPDPAPRGDADTPPTEYSDHYPREIVVKFPGKCVKCGVRIERDETALHVARGKIQHKGECPGKKAPLVPEAPKPTPPSNKVNGDKAFMESLASLMMGS